MTHSNTALNNEQAIEQQNRQVIHNASAVNGTTQCNFTNNYYGDQLCKTVVPQNQCNYSDNYYGDQLCITPEKTPAQVLTAASNDNAIDNTVAKKTDCNYSNNYYGDQLCKVIN